jgi:hypothetical protein
VTSQVELPEEPHTPPIVIEDPSYPIGTVIKFDASKYSELQIPITVYDEDVSEELHARFRISSNTVPSKTYVDCADDHMIPVSGNTLRINAKIVISEGMLERNACSTIDYVVASSFVAASCTRRPELWNATNPLDDNGTARFMVWEVSGDLLMDPVRTQALAATCQSVDGTPPTTMMMDK